MPYINIKTTKKLTVDEEVLLKEKLGEAITIFPGKSEDWLMCNIESDSHLWFQGKNDSDIAFIEVKLFGNVNETSSDRFTAEICDYLETNLNIEPSKVYVRYSGGTSWGWNGNNF